MLALLDFYSLLFSYILPRATAPAPLFPYIPVFKITRG